MVLNPNQSNNYAFIFNTIDYTYCNPTLLIGALTLKIVSNLTQGWKVNRKLNKCPTRQIGKETNHDKKNFMAFPKTAFIC
jgi:hypothetical protein